MRQTRRMRFTLIGRLLIALLTTGLFVGPAAMAQTTVSGAVNGTVMDPSGAAIVGATVTLTNVATGAVQTAMTNATGSYSFPFLTPGDYNLKAASEGFQTVAQNVTVSLGTALTSNLRLSVSAATQIVEVIGEGGAVDVQDANLATNFNSTSIAALPNPGNDISAIALTAPGVVMNTTGGSQFGGGGYSIYGLPASSNLFTIDGANNNDPYFNINNTGATNLTLGLNDVQESTVVSNGYSGQYGGLAGANINSVTKSGSNSFHGNAVWWWNGRALNANEYFRNQAGQGRAFVNANQYAGSLGGPIKKDKAFFFFDYEGIRLVIPSPIAVNLPTQQFETAVLAGLPVAEVPLYTKMFNLYNNTPNASSARNVLPQGTDANGNVISGPGCNNYTGFNDTTTPCALQLQAGSSAHTKDWLATGKVDWNVSNNDRAFLRINREHGLQATYTDPISSDFTAISDQPSWQGQFSETHTFGANKVNNFLSSFTWYSAGFNLSNPQQTSLPFSLQPLDGSLFPLNNFGFLLPQGRNITQYQFVDDFSWARGRHTFKFGVNFHRSDVTDFSLPILATPFVGVFTLADFAAGGGADLIQQNFPTQSRVPIALYQLGFYVADDLKATQNLKLTLSLRMDHLSNPVCQTNCFQRLASDFETLDRTTPVNQAILFNQHALFPSVTGIVAEPRIGFAWSPLGSTKTVLRGGAGVFVDALPTGAIDNILASPPLVPSFLEFFAPLAGPGNLFSLTQADNAAFQANFASGGAVPPFSFNNPVAVKPPRYYEWSLEIQREVGRNTTVGAMYVGNHGNYEAMPNPAINAFGFANLPPSAPDPRFSEVTQQANVANSNYNGMVLKVRHAGKGGVQFQASYTYGHALDEVSNNPFAPFGLNTTGINADITAAQDPLNIAKYNYGNADYDIRQYFTMNYVWSDAFRHITKGGPNALLKGWTFSGTIFKHTGFPYTIYSSDITGALSGNNYGNGTTPALFASVIGPSNVNCGNSAALLNNPCYKAANFADPAATFDPVTGALLGGNYGQQRRNQFRGPGLFDTDFAVEKGFGLPKWEGASVSVAARFFNLFNHPNFAFPVTNIDSPQFGQILSTISTPTSIYGSGLGANSSPRLVQLQLKFQF